MARYRLSSKAESDLFHIALYGLQEFGLTQSERYRDQLNARFAEIAETPLLYPAVDHIRAGHRRSVFPSLILRDCGRSGNTRFASQGMIRDEGVDAGVAGVRK